MASASYTIVWYLLDFPSALTAGFEAFPVRVLLMLTHALLQALITMRW